ncbi:junctional adhesion molecule 2a isoform X1 [Lates japonicus]|uniref:Junctional adhesion molecule 2a isoform X1 n=1 Tax=Lates japonicus TaxID=270547 RepID=A0AAD3REG0_LATJO|nr:junctional adhesion molecule 2a isoform X1 [Lates japonicus]
MNYRRVANKCEKKAEARDLPPRCVQGRQDSARVVDNNGGDVTVSSYCYFTDAIPGNTHPSLCNTLCGPRNESKAAKERACHLSIFAQARGWPSLLLAQLCPHYWHVTKSDSKSDAGQIRLTIGLHSQEYASVGLQSRDNALRRVSRYAIQGCHDNPVTAPRVDARQGEGKRGRLEGERVQF